MSMWLATPEQIEAIDRAILDELRKQMISESKLMPNGCWRCIGCGRFLPKGYRWNQCADCDTRTPEGL